MTHPPGPDPVVPVPSRPDEYATLSLVVVSERVTATALHLAALPGHEAFDRLAVSVVDLTGQTDQADLTSTTPWVTVLPAPATRGVGPAVDLALGSVTTRFVMFTDTEMSGQARFARAIERGEILAGRYGLLDAPFALFTPISWSELFITARYRAWVEAHHGAWVAQHRVAFDAYLQALPLRNLAARLDGLDVVGGGAILRVTGMCRRGATDGPEPPDHGVRLLVVDGSGDVVATADTESAQRLEAGQLRWVGFTAEVPISQLPLGRATLDVALSSPPGEEDVRVAVKAARGALAASRPVVTAGRRFQLFPVHGSGRAEVVTQAATNSVSRWGWSWMVMRRDLGALLRRRPFSWARPVRVLTRPLIGRGPVWLVGERPDTARDNGFHLFVHLRRERPDIRAYYVLDRESEQFAAMSSLGRVIAHSSWRHRLLMLHAQVLLNAYSLTHMLPRGWDKSVYLRQFAWRIGAYRVYLKHGIHMDPKVLKRYQSGFDLFLTASERETAAARKTSGYGAQITPTGLPRYDALVPTPPSRRILLMPTWRMYLAPRLFSEETDAAVPFEGSTYQQFMVGLLSAPRLHDMLARHDYRLDFMPHYNMRTYLAEVPGISDRISVLDGGASNIQDVMRRCDLFITDHSSVHFDLAYLGTPLIYTHFDDDEYRSGHANASWFDHQRDGFGPVTQDVPSTLDAIEFYLDNECVREPEYSRRAQEAFIFHDRENSRRAVEAIETLVRTQGIR